MASSSQSSRVNLFSSSPELLQSDDSLPPFSPVAVFDDSPSPSHTSHRPPEKLQELYLTPDEWKQVQYVIVILFPFWQYTQAISISRDISIHLAWQIYNKLFQHLESRSREAERERTWKEPLVNALQAAKDRLSDYYSQTDNEFGIFYAVTVTGSE